MANNCRRQSDEGSHNASAKAPHFFKVILSSEPRLRIPPKFVRKYGHNLPSIVLLEAPTGPIWQVELTRTNGESWLEKGFQAFKEYYSIGLGYFLVFRYDEDFYFQVLIFDTSATEIDYSYTVPKQKHRNNIFDSSCNLKEGRQIDSDNSVEILERIPTWQKGEGSKQKVANPIDKETSVEVLNDFSTKRNAKRKRRETEDDVSIEILDGFPMCKKATETPENFHSEEKKAAKIKVALPGHRSKSIQNKRVKLEATQADAVPPYLKQGIKKECNAGTGSHLQPSISGSKQTVIAKEKVIAYQRAKAFKSKNPFFISFMQPTYVSRQFSLTIRKTFAQKYLTDQRCDVVLRVPDGRTWKVKCNLGYDNAKFRWKKFVQDNGLDVGDVCVFERENDTKYPFLNVIIFRTIEDSENCLHRNMNAVNSKLKSSH